MLIWISRKSQLPSYNLCHELMRAYRMAYHRIAKSQRTGRGIYLGQHDLLLTEPLTQTDNLEVPLGTGLLASSQVHNMVPFQLRNLASNGILTRHSSDRSRIGCFIVTCSLSTILVPTI